MSATTTLAARGLGPRYTPGYKFNARQDARRMNAAYAAAMSKASEYAAVPEIGSDPNQSMMDKKKLLKAHLEDRRQARAQLVKDQNDAVVFDMVVRELFAGDDEVRIANSLLKGCKNADRLLGYESVPGEALPAKTAYEMGSIGANSAKAKACESMTHQLLSKMNTGSDLHIHANTLPYPIEHMEFALKHLRETFHISFSNPLTETGGWDDCEITFEVWPEGTEESDPREPGYVSIKGNYEYYIDGKPVIIKKKNAGMLFYKFVENFNKWYSAYEGRQTKYYNRETGEYDALLWCLDRIVITEEDMLAGTCQCNKLWAKFNMGTRAWKNLVNVESLYRKYCDDTWELLKKHGRKYAEFRFIWTEAGIMRDDGTGLLSIVDQIIIYLKSWDRFYAAQCAAGRRDEMPFRPKIGFSIPRGIPLVPVRNLHTRTVYECWHDGGKAMKARQEVDVPVQSDADWELNITAKFQQALNLALYFRDVLGIEDVISFVDVVGAEDRGRPTVDLYEILIKFRIDTFEHGLNIPFNFHSGESNNDQLGTPDPDNSGSFDLVNLDIQRIGHGLSLTKFAFIVAALLAQNENGGRHAIEVNVSSNVKLGAIGSANEHPIQSLANRGFPFVICTDNPNLFDTDGHLEFTYLFLGWARLELYGLFQSVLWSYQYSLLNDAEVQELCHIACREFMAYCAEMAHKDNIAKVMQHYESKLSWKTKRDIENSTKFMTEHFPDIYPQYLESEA